MAWTLDDLAALERAMASGTLSVRYEDMSKTYRSLDEMRRIRTQMRDELGLNKKDSTRRYPTFRKGLE